MDMIPFGQLQLMSPPSSDVKKTVMDKGDIALAGRGKPHLSAQQRPNGDILLLSAQWPRLLS